MTETFRDIAEYQSDHDLLIVLNERVSALILAVNNKTGDHEQRIRWLEKRGWMLTGGAIGASTIIEYVLKLLHI